jgi:hypothetical protein
MKWSKYAAILVVLNVGLLGAVSVLLFKLHQPLPRITVAPAASVAPTSSGLRPEDHVLTAAAETNSLSWQQLESEDYRMYIQRLRAIGCPEQTIRDIIIADVDKTLAPRMQSIVPYRSDLKYWQPEAEELAYSYDQREWLRKQREVDFQKREVIRELLGVDLVGERLKQQGKEDYYGRRLGFLAEDKRGQVRTVIEKYSDQELALREKEWEEGETLSPDDRAKLARLRQDRQAELAKLLTPAEQQNYDLWLGFTANKVREALYGMDATEDEFLKIYRLRKSFDDQWNPEELDLNDPAMRARWEQANHDLSAQIEQQLGEDRYALYERGQDPDFRALNAVAARYKLPARTVADAYAYKKIAVEARESVTGNTSLSQEQKEAALKAMSEETEKTIKETLGEKAYNYLRLHGHATWIKN